MPSKFRQLRLANVHVQPRRRSFASATTLQGLQPLQGLAETSLGEIEIEEYRAMELLWDLAFTRVSTLISSNCSKGGRGVRV